MSKYAIIGAGIAGLSSAWYLSEKYPEAEITIFESDRKGGKIHSVDHENARLEEGPAYIIAENPAVMEIAQAIKAENLLTPIKDKKFFYRNQGYQAKIPSDFLSLDNNFLSFIGSGINSFFGLKKKVSVWDNTTLFDLLKSTMGETYAETLGSVYARFVFRDEVENIDFSSSFPQIENSAKSNDTLKKIMEDVKKKRPEQWRKLFSSQAIQSFKPGFYSFEGGLSVFTNRLADALKAKPNIKFEFEKIHGIKAEPHVSLHSKKNKFGSFDKVLFAIPSSAASDIWKSTDKSLAQKLGELKTHSVNIVYSAWNRKNTHVPGFAYYTPRKEKLSVYGMEFISNAFPDSVSKDTFLIRMILPGDLSMLSDKDMVDLTATDLKKAYSLSDVPLWSKVFRHNNALPRRDKSYRSWKKDVQELMEKHNHTVFIGSDFTGPGICNSMERIKHIVENEL